MDSGEYLETHFLLLYRISLTHLNETNWESTLLN